MYNVYWFSGRRDTQVDESNSKQSKSFTIQCHKVLETTNKWLQDVSQIFLKKCIWKILINRKLVEKNILAERRNFNKFLLVTTHNLVQERKCYY